MVEQLFTTETVTPDALISGSHPPVKIPIRIAVTEETTIERGALLEADVNNKYKPYSSGNTVVIAAEKKVLAANSSCSCMAFAHGEFNPTSLSGATLNAALKQKLQGLGLYLKEVK